MLDSLDKIRGILQKVGVEAGAGRLLQRDHGCQEHRPPVQGRLRMVQEQFVSTSQRSCRVRAAP